MTIALFTVLTIVALSVTQLIYVVACAITGSFVGATPEVISVGFGPVIWSKMFGAIDFRLSAVPFGGYTKFYGNEDDYLDEEELESEDAPVPLVHLPILSRGIILLSGPLTNLLTGGFLLFAATFFQESKVVINPQANAVIRLTGVPHLGIEKENADWNSHWTLFKETFVKFWHHTLTQQDLKGWGGFVSCLVTSSAAAAASPSAWLSCFGIICIGLGISNLVPIPVLNGGAIVMLIIEACFGKPSEQFVHVTTYAGIILALMLMGYLVLCDIGWILLTLLGVI